MVPSKKRVIWSIACSITLCLLLSAELSAESPKKPGPFNDGPYVFRDQATVIIKTIVNGELKTEEIELSETEMQSSTPVTLKIKATGKELLIHPGEFQRPKAIYSGVKKMLVTSDVHGNVEPYTAILKNSGVIDENLDWSFGEGHLVLCGDNFDRGKYVNEALWLTYKLELQAKAAGGMVHVLLGNHDEWILAKNHRKGINGKYKKTDEITGMNQVELYGPSSELGRWLRTKNMMEKIDDFLFVHGGVKSEVAQDPHTIEYVNNKGHRYFNTPPKNKGIKGWGKVSSFLGTRTFFKKDKSKEGKPYTFLAEDMATVLAYYDVKHVVVGHSSSNRLRHRLGGAVIGVDTGQKRALYWEEGAFFSAEKKGPKIPIDITVLADK